MKVILPACAAYVLGVAAPFLFDSTAPVETPVFYPAVWQLDDGQAAAYLTHEWKLLLEPGWECRRSADRWTCEFTAPDAGTRTRP